MLRQGLWGLSLIHLLILAVMEAFLHFGKDIEVERKSLDGFQDFVFKEKLQHLQ